MKPIHDRSIKKATAYFLVLLTLVFSTGCFHEFYKITPANRENLRQMADNDHSDRYFVLYHKGVAMQLQDLLIQEGSLQGILSELPPDKANFARKNRNALWMEVVNNNTLEKDRRYRPGEKYIIHAAHVYLKDEANVSLAPGFVIIPRSAIEQVHIYAKDNGRTFASHFFPIAGVAGFTSIIVGIGNIDWGPLDMSAFKEK